MPILEVVQNIFGLLDSKTKIRYIALQIFFLFSAVIQVIGVASLAPFITLLSNPDLIQSNEILHFAYVSLTFESETHFIIGFAGLSITLIVLANTTKAFTTWLLIKFSVSLGISLQQDLYLHYLTRPFLFHKQDNYTKNIATISHEAPRFLYMVFIPFLDLTSNVFIALIIIIGLVFLDPYLALTAILLVGGAYAFAHSYLKGRLITSGEKVSRRNSLIQAILSESFVGIKEIILGNLSRQYVDKFRTINRSGLNAMAFITLAADIPKYIIETVTLSAILIFSMYLLLRDYGFDQVISVLSLYALAGYKLLPTVQQIYKSISNMSAHGIVSRRIRNELSQKSSQTIQAIDNDFQVESIELKNASFQYPNANKFAIKSIDLKLDKGHIYALAGHSGSGKSTLADVLLGLLSSTSVKLLVNGEELTDVNLKSYQKRLSYISQQVFILDDSVSHNVIFGSGQKEANPNKIYRVLELASAKDFVNELSNSIETSLGQDGKLLSGGERQRIGLARALYKECDVLILDEPTSALDMNTEYEFLQTLNNLKEDLIILVISHRLASVKMSDSVILMKEGVIVGHAPYEELVSKNHEFREMVNKGAGENS